jgi:glucose/arabinose dehydrogenase
MHLISGSNFRSGHKYPLAVGTIASALVLLPWLGGILFAETLYQVQAAFPKLQFTLPVFITHPPDGSRRLFVIEQMGRVLWFENTFNPDAPEVALDISHKVRHHHMEEGLLGMAFHPKFKKNRQVYLFYSASEPRRVVVSEFRMNRMKEKIKPKTERILLEVPQPFGNHNGGMIQFGPDGYLYISLGDGGGAGDTKGHAQNLQRLLGKILRIDVDTPSTDKPYSIPDDNPFVDHPRARKEIYALGLRNVWRFSFDEMTGDIWAGDRGQYMWEEVNIIQKGQNYGWNVLEGLDLYSKNPPHRGPGPMIPPIFKYSHEVGQSITGGTIYKGSEIPELYGTYIYGDFMSGQIWSLEMPQNKKAKNTRLATGTPLSSIGTDARGELYFLALHEGKIYQLKKK